MSGLSPEEALKGYFDDLLLDPTAADSESTDRQRPATAPSEQRQQANSGHKSDFVEEPLAAQPSPQRAQAISRPSLDVPSAVEAVARQKLARLLATAELKISEPSTAEPVAPEAVEPRVSVTSTPELDQEHLTLKAKLEVLHEEVIDEAAIEAQRLAEEASLLRLTWHENGRPQWAQERFEVLLFSVAGLTLAVPLIALGQIQPLTNELTPLFGQADWFMGLQPTPMGKIRTVNTAKFVMPERYDERFLETAKYVISIDGLPWGLAVDAVNQPIMVEPDDVKWRSQRSKRAWLAGTVKQHMCALIDIPIMGQILEESDANKAD